MRILYLILAKYEELWESDRKSQEDTWAKGDSKKIIRYLYGATENNPSSSNSMFVDCLDEYDHILQKTILGLQKALKHLEFEFAVRTNVSTFFNDKKLSNKIALQPKDIPIALGYFEQHKKEYRCQLPNKLFISGSAIIINRNAAKILAEMDWEIYKSIPDDIAISHYLSTRGVTLKHLARSNYHITHLPLEASIYRLKSSEFSHLTSKRMNLINQLGEESNFIGKFLIFCSMLRLEIATSFNNESFRRDFLVRPLMHVRSRLKCRIALRSNKIECL
jgi:hypothetical protein